MDTDDLDYDLPEEAIAQTPAEPRDAARLLVDRGAGSAPEHRVVAELPSLLRPGDLLVINDTRVRPARLRLRKATGGEVEVLLLREGDDAMWEALVRPARRLRAGMVLSDRSGVDRLEIGADLGDGRRLVRALTDLEAVGEVPLPPYIRAPLADPERYQTVYARRPASAAAPTAGLHLTERVLAGCRDAGVAVASIELEVGLATFRPITTARVEDHAVHEERYAIAPDVWEACRAAARVVAVGTTTVRALEAAASTGSLSGATTLFIRPGFRFSVVDLLMTNFHVPRTSLLALVEAFVGPRWRALYAEALAQGYRFLSFGDAMLLERRDR